MKGKNSNKRTSYYVEKFLFSLLESSLAAYFRTDLAFTSASLPNKGDEYGQLSATSRNSDDS